jgi:hypothetical protein
MLLTRKAPVLVAKEQKEKYEGAAKQIALNARGLTHLNHSSSVAPIGHFCRDAPEFLSEP